MRLRGRWPAAAAAALALAAAGCGSDEPSDEEQVREAVAAFGRATAAKDYQQLCDRLLARSLVEEVEQIGLPCEVALQQGLGEVEDPKLTIGKVTVQDDKARAEVRTAAANQPPSRDTLQLVRADDGWRISSLG